MTYGTETFSEVSENEFVRQRRLWQKR